ncbi:MAG: DNA-3-methyladenine glycosylase 2 family protein [Ignavibacteriae bacterium]|nr:DNA-3-methyladenine glycosylase 2 family protein [Ignavibacteriota bacterium]
MNKAKTISIPIPKNFSFNQCIKFLDRGFDECLYRITKDSVSRLIKLSDGNALIKISSCRDVACYISTETNNVNILQIEILKNYISEKNIDEVKEYVSDWFDIDRDIQLFYDLLYKNELLGNLPKLYYGSRLIGIPDLFESLCWGIIGQQINLTFAYKLKRLLVEKYGDKKVVDDVTYHFFPTPEVLAKVDRDELVKMKFSRQKIDYIINVSNTFVNNKISKAILLNCKTKNKRFEKLTSIKGIGIWTANYVMMKTMRDMTCITYGDSGLNKALYNIFRTEKKPTQNEVDSIFQNFNNWESYLNFYLWRTLE